MRQFLRLLAGFIGGFLALAVLVLFLIWLCYGGGELLEDRSSDPLIPFSAVEVVADLDVPPGNIAVSSAGRVFFTFHPESSPHVQLVELVDGKTVAYPNNEIQHFEQTGASFQSVLSIRIDRQDRLWVLDYAHHGFGQPRLFGFDLQTDKEVRRYDFPSDVAPWGSQLNDFQVGPQGNKIYIADASVFGQRPAIVIYDVERDSSRRVLDRHHSVVPDFYVPVVEGQQMIILGVFAVRPGVDSIALDRQGEWLYYAPLTEESMYRVRTRDLNEDSLEPEELAERVEIFAPKTMSDGISTDLDGNIYLTDLEHSAIVMLDPDRQLRTLLKDPRLRWPDGLSFGPDGWLYIACSSLHHVIMRSPPHVRAHAPYQIFRFRPGPSAYPGH